jgi:putative endonuclease
MTDYYVYILNCADHSLYTGITTDLKRRLREHNSSGRGAKYTRTRRPVSLVYSLKLPDRSTAAQAEARIKKLPRGKKLELTRVTKRQVANNKLKNI